MNKNSDSDLNKNLIDYLNFYLKNHTYQHAVLINGKWGCGKTFFIKNQIKEWSKSKEKISEDGVILKPIYVSLYGISKTSEINEKIKTTLNPLLHSKPVKALSNVLMAGLKFSTQSNVDFDSNGVDEGKVSFDINSMGLLKSFNKKIKGNKILIFDDLERCDIELNQLFGYINEFVEHYRCKVILLTDEEILEGKNEVEEGSKVKSYNSFKEKLIGQTFTLQINVQDVINSFIKDVESTTLSTMDDQTKEIIEHIFLTSEIENLRILKQSIVDFKRFISQIKVEHKKHPRYKEYMSQLFAYFLIIYLEFKSGNKEVLNIKSYQILYSLSDSEQYIYKKYNQLIKHYEIEHYSKILPFGYITNFIRHGYCNHSSLNEAINNNAFFKAEEIEEWEELWLWQLLEDETFEVLYKSVLSDFNKSKFDNPFKLTHVVTIFLSLLKNNIIDIDKDKLLENYKQKIDSLFIANQDKLYAIPSSNHSWGKEYRENKSIEYIEMNDYFKEKVIFHNQNLKDDYLQNLFENLANDTIKNLYTNLSQSYHKTNQSYVQLPLLATTNGEKLAYKILNFSTENIHFFFGFMQTRYDRKDLHITGYLSEYSTEELSCLIELNKTLKIEILKQKPIKRFNLTNYLTLLDKIISRLKQ